MFANLHPFNSFQSSRQMKFPNEMHRSHSNQSTEPRTSSSQPFFLQRPSVTHDLASRLIPVDVDLHTKKNTEEHSTNHYDSSGLVLRRGQPFSFTVTFNRDYNPEEHQLYVRLATGNRSMVSKRTQLRLLVDGTSNDQSWSAKLLPSEDETRKNRVSIQISSPSDAIIGKYTLLLEVRPLKDDTTTMFDPTDLRLFLFEVDLYFLFNPWQKDDACALPSSEQIAEYVMNEHGQIYMGSSEKPQLIPWYFGQFERSALLTALTLLDRAQLPHQNRSDPSVILRLLLSKICSNPRTNSGIFPSSFDQQNSSVSNESYTSSSAILKQYHSSNGRSIPGGGGSDWQHAAVLCSLARALGIPCRVVTVYNAACRTDGTENNDIHWDLKQRPLEQLNFDLICSSHVWNECWMRRDDLAQKNADWQVIDSTPVQMCDGIRRTGPCAVSTLKNGQLGYRWDSPVLHSTIYGHKAHWKVYPDGNMELLDVEENSVGRKILTRSLKNEYEPEDLTEQYKTSTTNSNTLEKRKKDDVQIQLKFLNNSRFGENVVLELNAKNQSDQSRTLIGALTICVMNKITHRVLVCHNIPSENLHLDAKENKPFPLTIPNKSYLPYGHEDDLTVKYYLHVQIKETNQVFTREENVVFTKENCLKLKLEEDVLEIGQPVRMTIEITNPLAHPLQRGRVAIDGLGINQIIPLNRVLAPKTSAVLRTQLQPTRLGVSRLYVTFLSDQMCSLTQTIPLEIVGGPIEIKATEPPATEKVKTPLETPAQPIDEPKSLPEAPSPSTIESENLEKKSPPESPSKVALPSSEHEDEDAEELYLKKKPDRVRSPAGTNLSAANGSTLSLDKDKMSIDSLDISTDRRNLATNSNNS